MAVTALAPGKAMLFGEYAVLDGAWGLVTAVDRYASARVVAGQVAASAFVENAALAADRYLRLCGVAARADGAPVVDSTALYADGNGARKLGLGSSAAVTVAAFGAAVAATGTSVEERPQHAFSLCDGAHARAQGVAGSGLDVGAAVFGGTVRARRAAGMLVVEPVQLPDGIAVVLVDTGVAASTADRVARYRALDGRHDGLKARLRALADATTAAALVAATPQWNALLGELEHALDVEIVTPAHARIAATAHKCGGAAKPSGAGGGDLAVCFVPASDAARLRQRLLEDGFRPLDVTVGARGLHAIGNENKR